MGFPCISIIIKLCAIKYSCALPPAVNSLLHASREVSNKYHVCLAAPYFSPAIHCPSLRAVSLYLDIIVCWTEPVLGVIGYDCDITLAIRPPDYEIITKVIIIVRRHEPVLYFINNE